ncbi:MAG: flavodoxin family protein [Clostridia bacterium]|nr:flavodoxin family protein [Clostridia bacterium]MBQ1435723.1 flavodoxin family protein [Clostridia bacterium]MBQ4249670.1 flavodoxin family protein [Clostridia bacterium]
MKVLLVCGSPNEHGCTYTALDVIKETLAREGIEAHHFHIGKKPISGCIACRKCAELGRCVFDDKVNEFTRLAAEYDGFVFGSPVYYAGMNGSMMSFMDRVFYSSSKSGKAPFYLKPAAAVVSARRAGTTAAIDQLNKYFLYAQMPIISSRYWNMVHGNTPEEVKQDTEGLQIMRVLARNMAWFLKIKEAGEKAGIKPPEGEERISFNYIR